MKLFSRMALAITALVSVASIGGVAASWHFADGAVNSYRTEANFVVNGFVYTPEEMPDVEVTAVQRLSDVLNKKFTTEKVQDSLDFLLNETIQVYWDNDKTQDPFVGSMDNTYKDEVEELFGDVLHEQGEDVAFILKNQDLNNDGYNEIAMYSTSDPLDNSSSSYKGIVCVYVTVFTPTLDRSGNIIGYKQLCESLRGYCNENYYSPSYRVPSFSTDTWLDSVGYTRWFRDYELPENAKLDYNSYNLEYNGYDTKLMGNSLATVLRDKF